MTENNTYHQLSAIVFTDIVGYTATMDNDEANAMGMLNQSRKIINSTIKKFDGELLKEIGDGNLLTFNSAINAVNCSIEIQQKIREIDGLELRIGVHLGDVIVEGDDVFGSGVNIASRIQRIAAAGEIYISSEIYLQIKNQKNIESENVGSRSIKGIEKSIIIYKVTEADIENQESELVEENISFFQNIIQRRVPHFTGVYIAVGWTIIQFVDWMVNRYTLSPHLIDLSFASVLSMIPSIIILAYFHGKPGKDEWTQVEKIGIPVNIIGSLLILFTVFSPKDLGAATATIFAENEKGERIKRTIPKAEFRKSIAIFNFKNNINEPELSWISNGLTQGIDCDLSQEMYIFTNSNGVTSKLMEKGFTDSSTPAPFTLKREISNKLHLTYFLDGTVEQNENKEFVVTTNLFRSKDAKKQGTHTYINSDIFTIIDEITAEIRYDVDIPSGYIETSVDLPIKEIMTNSITAYKNYVNGTEKFVQSDFETSIFLLEKAVEEDESFAMALIVLQTLYQMTNQGDKQLDIIKAAMKYLYKVPERYQYIIKLVYFYTNGEPDKGKQVVEMQLELFPQDITAHEIMAQLQLGVGDFSRVIEHYKMILQIDPSRYEKLLEVGDLYKNQKQYSNALKYYDMYLKNFPNDYQSHLKMARLYQQEERKEEALESYETVLVLDPNNLGTTLSIIALEYEGSEQIDETYATLEICKTAEDTVMVYETIEEELRQHGRISEVIKNWEIYRELQKTYLPFAYYALANVFYPAEYIRIGENDKALKLMREFERTYVSPADAYINLGYLLLYVEMEDGEKAKEYLSKTTEMLEKQGKEIITDKMITQNGIEATVARLNGDIDGALELLEKNPNKDRTAIRIELAKCYRLKKEFKKAKKINLDECSDNKEAFFELALLYYDMEEEWKAKETLQEILDYYIDADPNYKLILKTKAKLNEWNSEI